MDTETKRFIESLDKRNIPWNRMFTAYGTAERYCEVLSVLEEIEDPEQWKKTFNQMSDFEHQSTMFPPAPFALVFLVRILEKLIRDGADDAAEWLTGQLMYYLEVCTDADRLEHAQPLGSFSDLLRDENLLLSEDNTEEDLENIFEDPGLVPDDLFYSFYYYSRVALSQVPSILDKYGKFPEISTKFR